MKQETTSRVLDSLMLDVAILWRHTYPVNSSHNVAELKLIVNLGPKEYTA